MRQLTSRMLVVVLAGMLILSTYPARSAEFGEFVGELDPQWLPDGRNMKLRKPFSFQDRRGRKWDVPAGAETDGASVPEIFWAAYPPFTGKYRTAAVVHDFYCQRKSRSWRDTHRVFFEAMRASNVDEQTAKILYAAVYYFGPRWGTGGTTRGPGAASNPNAAQQSKSLADIEKWIATENPDFETIDDRLETPNPF